MEPIKKKIWNALEYASVASIYSPEDTIPELSTAQTSVLTLFYGLLFDDLPLCEFILSLQVPQLKSTFLRVWLAEDFSFNRHDVSMVLTMLSYILENKQVFIQNHILMIFGSLVEKYGVADCCCNELLVLFHEGQVTKKEDTKVMYNYPERKSSFKSRNDEASNTGKTTNSLRDTIRRTGNIKLKWFHGWSRELSKDVEDKYFPKEVTANREENESPDTTWYADESFQEDKVVKYPSENLSRITAQKNFSDGRALEIYSNVDNEGRTLLHRLAQFGKTEAVRRILEEGVKPDVQDNAGKTALHWAVEYDHPSVVKLLLRFGANVNARTKTGRKPLSFAHSESECVSSTWKIIIKHRGTI